MVNIRIYFEDLNSFKAPLNLSANASMGRQIRGGSCIAFARQEFRMVPPKMHGQFRVGLPKMHRRFLIDLPKMHGRFVLAFLKCMD